MSVFQADSYFKFTIIMSDDYLKFTPAFCADRHRENNAQYYQRNTAGKAAAKLL